MLSPGTYTFRLLNSESDRDIVQIFNAAGTKLYTTVMAIPDYRLDPTSKTVITFEERAKYAPEAINSWFYPGALYGLEFVYPKVKSVDLAARTVTLAHGPVKSLNWPAMTMCFTTGGVPVHVGSASISAKASALVLQSCIPAPVAGLYVFG